MNVRDIGRAALKEFRTTPPGDKRDCARRCRSHWIDQGQGQPRRQPGQALRRQLPDTFGDLRNAGPATAGGLNEQWLFSNFERGLGFIAALREYRDALAAANASAFPGPTATTVK